MDAKPGQLNDPTIYRFTGTTDHREKKVSGSGACAERGCVWGLDASLGLAVPPAFTRRSLRLAAPQGRSAPVVVAAPFPPRAAPHGEVFQRAHHYTPSSSAPYSPSHLLLQVELGLTPTRNVARTTSSPPTFEFVMFKADHDRHPLRGWSRRMKHTALGARRGCTDTRYGLTNTGLKFPS